MIKMMLVRLAEYFVLICIAAATLEWCALDFDDEYRRFTMKEMWRTIMRNKLSFTLMFVVVAMAVFDVARIFRKRK